jgi:hypothetical protein
MADQRVSTFSADTAGFDRLLHTLRAICVA